MKRISLLALSFLTPVVAFAQNNSQLTTLIGYVQDALSRIIPIIIILGVLYVIWGVISFVTKTNEEERAKAKGIILYGIIGLFVVVSIWGLVGFLGTLTGVGSGGNVNNYIPCVVDTQPTVPGCQP